MSELSYLDVRPILTKVADLERDLVLVGGQAVNFWASIYEGRVPALARERPFVSKDIEFCGAVKAASTACPSLANRKISPHTLRHTTAMHLLQAGVDLSSIALCLGHVSQSTTHTYVEADLAMREWTLEKLAPPSTRSHRFRADDRLLALLNSL